MHSFHSPRKWVSWLWLFSISALLAQGAENGEKSIFRILIIGDSISIGYTQPLKELFKGEAEVHHNPGNAQHSGHGLAHLGGMAGRCILGRDSFQPRPARSEICRRAR